MTGKQANVTRRGAIHEDDAKAILRRLSSVIPVPRQDDYGIDFYCQEYSNETTTSHESQGIFGIQIKSSLDEYELGGLDRKGTWKEYDLSWYRSLSIPYFLGIIGDDGNQLAIYSLISTKCVYHKATEKPFKIQFKSECKTKTNCRFEEPVSDGSGNIVRWICNLGLPIIQLHRSQLSDSDLVENCRDVLSKWIEIDRINAVFLSFGLQRVVSYNAWSPNVLDTEGIIGWDYWQIPLRKELLIRLSRIAGPSLALMNKNYEASHGEPLPGIKELDDWMKANGMGDPFMSILS